MPWAVFVERYCQEHLTGLARRTMQTSLAAISKLERACSPNFVGDVTGEMLSRFVSALRSDGLSETTIHKHLRHIKAAMRWAAEVGIVSRAPNVPRIQRAKQSAGSPHRGRAVTDEEFKKIVKAIPAVVPPGHEAGWEWYIRGLWLSGLRLTESLDLWWDNPHKMRVDLSHSEAMLIVPASSEKGHRDRHLPVAPEFADALMAVPKRMRKGLVFPIPKTRQKGRQPQYWWVSRIVCSISEKAGVFTEPGKPAGCHDLRRSFGVRWASRVMPQTLMKIMRHESIVTTMRYYVTEDAQRTVREMRAAMAAQGDFQGDGKTSPVMKPRKN